jgi:hypothetical protein
MRVFYILGANFATILIGTRMEPNSNDRGRPGLHIYSLYVDCGRGRGSAGKFIEGNLLVGVPLKIHYVEPTEIHGTSYFPKVFVKLRVDDSTKSEKRNWTPGKDKTSAVFAKYSIKKILRAHTVEITTEDENGSEVSVQFDVPDSKSVQEACNVDTKK